LENKWRDQNVHDLPHLTPALSPPSDGAEREKGSQRLGKMKTASGLKILREKKIGQLLSPLPAGEGERI
jgi:hypothetical protein